MIKQRVFVMRHGERLDSQYREWRKTAARPYDTPITSRGEREARRAGGRFAGLAVSLVFSSPFLRCLQTAHQVCQMLDLPGVHICNGLSEMICSGCNMDGQPDVPGSDIQEYGVKIVSMDSSPIAQFPEKVEEARARYAATINRLADEHWPGNLVLVSHEYAVMEAMKVGGKLEEYEATYCSSVGLSRTSKAEHSWTIENYHGVFRYETVL